MKTGMVLEGGAMRGMFTCGVLDVLMEHHIQVDGMIGVSAGACFGCNYVSKQPGRAIRYNKRFAGDWRYASFKSWLKTGSLYGDEFDYHVVPYQYDLFDTKTFSENPVKYYVGTTNIETGKPEYMELKYGNDADLEKMRASASMPVFANIVDIDGGKYMDGGIADSVPIQHFEEMGYERNIVVLTQPYGFKCKKQYGIPALRLLYPQYPNMCDALAHRHEEYNRTTDYIWQQVAAGKAFVLQPEAPLNIGFMEHNPDEMQRVYDLGRKVAEKQLPALQQWVLEGKQAEKQIETQQAEDQ